MDDSRFIKVPADGNAAITIKSPHTAPYRPYNFNRRGASVCEFPSWTRPLQSAFSAAGLLPLPPNLADRLSNAIPKVRIAWRETSFDRYDSESRIRKNLDELAKGLKPERYEEKAELIFRFVFTPGDFTIEQKIKLFDYFTAKIVQQIDQEIMERIDSDFKRARGLSTWGGGSPCGGGLLERKKPVKEVYLVQETRALKTWDTWLSEFGVPKKPVEETVSKAISGWLEAQTAIRDMSGYDWQPLDFIFGDHLPTLVQLKTATLEAELKEAHDSFMRDYNNFLGRVKETLRLGGAMRNNSMTLDSLLLGKYRVFVCVFDRGRGLELAENLSDITELGKELGKAVLKLPFRILGSL